MKAKGRGDAMEWIAVKDGTISYLYEKGTLKGLVRDFRKLSLPGGKANWAAFDTEKNVQTYHETEDEAKRELERRYGAVARRLPTVMRRAG